MINMMVPLRTKDLLPEHIPALHFLARSDVSLAGFYHKRLAMLPGRKCMQRLPKSWVLYSRYHSEGQAQTYDGLTVSELILET